MNAIEKKILESNPVEELINQFAKQNEARA